MPERWPNYKRRLKMKPPSDYHDKMIEEAIFANRRIELILNPYDVVVYMLHPHWRLRPRVRYMVSTHVNGRYYFTHLKDVYKFIWHPLHGVALALTEQGKPHPDRRYARDED